MSKNFGSRILAQKLLFFTKNRWISYRILSLWELKREKKKNIIKIILNFIIARYNKIYFNILNKEKKKESIWRVKLNIPYQINF